MRTRAWWVVLLAALALTACTRSTTTPDRAAALTTAPNATASASATTTAPPTPAGTAPVDAGPTTTADGSCPFLTLDQALSDLGERLGRVTVATSGGTAVGCTFYPASGALATSEHLPPADVPAIAVTLTHYADTTAAHNAMVVASRVDPAAYTDPIPGADEAIAFATTFYAADGDQDRAFTFRKGTTVALVQIAQTKPAFNARQLATDVAAAVR